MKKINRKMAGKFVTSIILFLTSCFLLQAQNYNFYNYDIVDGLPQSQAYAICQDSHGYLWVGTLGGGVARFDGKKFETELFSEELNSDYIYSLYSLSDDVLLIGTDVGLNVYRNNKIIKVIFDDSRPHKINALVEWDKRILIGAEDGLFELYSEFSKAKAINRNNPAFNSRINELKVFNDRLWIASKKGLWFNNPNERNFNQVRGLPFPEVQTLAQDNNSNLWIGILGYGVLNYDFEAGKVVDKYTLALTYKPFSILIDQDKKVWVGTMEDGITIIDPLTKKMHLLNENNGLSSRNIRKIFSDSWGSIWIGTSGGGLIKKSSLPFKYYNPFDYGIRGKRVYSISTSQDENLFISLNSGILTTFDNTKFDVLGLDSINIHTKIKSIVSDGYTTWLGTEGQGVICFDSLKQKKFSLKTKIRPGYWVNHLIIDQGKKVWVAVRGEGIYCLKEEFDSIHILNRFRTKNGLLDDNINSLAKDNYGRIWFVSKNGNAGYINTDLKIINFGTRHGIPEKSIKTIALDSLNNVYLGIPGAGIFKANIKAGLNDLNFAKLISANSKYSNNIYSMICDKKNDLWVGSQNGVYKITIKNNEILESIHFTKNDGFYGIENCHNAVAIDRYQRIWFGTMNGLLCYDPEENFSNENPPVLNFENIIVSGEPLAKEQFYKTLELPYSKNNLIFEFKAIHLRFPEKVRYRYKLKGSEEKWTDWSIDEKVNLASLSPGNYEFVVESRLDGTNVSTSKEFKFSIVTPFWEKTWFYILLGLLALLLLFFISRFREKRIKRKNDKIKKELEIENKMLMLEQKALQLQMNPHFIFNTLNSIQSLVVENKMGEARLQIQNFAGLMRSVLNNSKKKTISLKEELDALTKYLEMEKFCQNNDFDFDFSFKSEIDIEEIEIPSMLIQPFVENAVIHGIAHLQNRGKIKITFEVQKEFIEISITDNGVGREKAKELRANKSTDHVSLGIDVTQQRLKSLAKGYKFNPIEISDLIDKENKPAGTKVILRIPATNNF